MKNQVELKVGDVVRCHDFNYPDMSLRPFTVYKVFKHDGIIWSVHIERDGLVWSYSPDKLTVEMVKEEAFRIGEIIEVDSLYHAVEGAD